jgi:ribosomal-protein-alanine N-acetyltransferase
VTTSVEAAIETPRMILHHLSAQDMITLFEDPENLSIYEGRPYTNPYRVLVDENRPLHWRVPQVRADPARNKWFVRFMVLKESGVIIGSTSFHAPPNAEGMVEIGLGLDAGFRARGYGAEAVAGMWTWAVDQPDVHTLRYTVSPANVASVRLVQRFGFRVAGQQIDKDDGPEDIYEMSATEFRRRYVAR